MHQHLTNLLLLGSKQYNQFYELQYDKRLGGMGWHGSGGGEGEKGGGRRNIAKILVSISLR